MRKWIAAAVVVAIGIAAIAVLDARRGDDHGVRLSGSKGDTGIDHATGPTGGSGVGGPTGLAGNGCGTLADGKITLVTMSDDALLGPLSAGGYFAPSTMDAAGEWLAVNYNRNPGESAAPIDRVLAVNLRTGVTQVVSNALDGSATEGNKGVMSSDGSTIAFLSRSDKIAPGDTNGRIDAFVYETSTGKIELISDGFAGDPIDRDVIEVALSGDGSVVVFTTDATNVVPGDTNGLPPDSTDDSSAGLDVFVKDRDRNATERVSVRSDGTESTGGAWEAGVSLDGQLVSFLAGYDRTPMAPEGFDGQLVYDLGEGSFLQDSNPIGGLLTWGENWSSGHQSALYEVAQADARSVPGITDEVVAALDAGFLNVPTVSEKDFVTSTIEYVSVPFVDLAPGGGVRIIGQSLNFRYVAFIHTEQDDRDGSGNISLRDGRIYVIDRSTGKRILAVTGTGGAPIAGFVSGVSISDDGCVMAFATTAANVGPDGGREGGGIYVLSSREHAS